MVQVKVALPGEDASTSAVSRCMDVSITGPLVGEMLHMHSGEWIGSVPPNATADTPAVLPTVYWGSACTVTRSTALASTTAIGIDSEAPFGERAITDPLPTASAWILT